MMKSLKRIQYWLIKSTHILNIILKRPHFVAALFFLALVWGCQKPEQDIGLGLQPGEDILNVNQVDTFTVEAYTLEEDSIRSDKLTPALLGAYNDPVFGFTKGGHVTELRLSTSNPLFVDGGATSDDMIIDSLVLFLGYENIVETDAQLIQYYANLGAQHFEVYEIGDSLSVDSIYYDNRSPRVISEDLVLEGFNRSIPNPSDSVTVGGEKRGPQLRLPLDPEFARKFIEASEDENGLSATTFVSLLKGLYVTVDETAPFVDPNGGGILYWDTFRERSGMTMYYRNPVTLDTLEYTFDIRSNTGKYTIGDHDFTTADMELLDQLEGNKDLGKQSLYVQALGGTKIRVTLPYMSQLADSVNLALNKVELILPIREDEDFPPPSRLFIFGLDEDEKLFLLPDQLDGLIGGSYNATNNEYRFVLTRYVQQILLGQREDFGLEIVSNRAAFSANRVVINGHEYPDPDNPSNNLKLAITLTNF